MTLIRLCYLSHSLGNRAITFTSETGLIEAWGATRTSLLALFDFSVRKSEKHVWALEVSPRQSRPKMQYLRNALGWAAGPWSRGLLRSVRWTALAHFIEQLVDEAPWRRSPPDGSPPSHQVLLNSILALSFATMIPSFLPLSLVTV